MHDAIRVESESTQAASRIELTPELMLVNSGRTDELALNGRTVVTVESGDVPGQDRGGSRWLVERVTAATNATQAQLCLALYQSLRRARISRKASVIVPHGVLRGDMLELVQATPTRRAGEMATRVDLALSKLAEVFEPVIRPVAQYYVQEVADTVRAHVESAFSEGFFRGVVDGRLSKEQYIYILAQQHGYVRFTTRILGYCVAYSEDSEIRRHFAKHLTGEVNHEKILEADLAYLGADVAYVVSDFEANSATMQFVLGELALVSHFHDPILLTAAPLVAEGISGHLGHGFVERLEALVRSWGHADPERATRFFSSHIDYDSGADGHFEGSMRMLDAYLTDERALRRYLAALHAQAECFLRIYSESMREMDAWE